MLKRTILSLSLISTLFLSPANAQTTDVLETVPRTSDSRSKTVNSAATSTQKGANIRSSVAKKPLNIVEENQIPGAFQDARNIKTGPNGKLLSVDGFEVDFKVFDTSGTCGTPSAIAPDMGNNAARAGCPFIVPCDNPTNRDASIPLPMQPIKYFRIRWVVVRNGGPTSNISQTRINQLMAELRADFAPWRIDFCSTLATFVTDATHYDLNAATEDASLKAAHGANFANVINVYVVNSISNPAVGGYAYMPYSGFGGPNPRGGIVLSKSNAFLGIHTLAHEVGHTFGLDHTFHGVDEVSPCSACYESPDGALGSSVGGDTEGDWCFDTNPHKTNPGICAAAGVDPCSALPYANVPVNNHMSYSYCSSAFTAQQAGRMHCMISTYLAGWVAFGGGTCGLLPPVADFIGTPTFWQAPANVTFSDQSVPSATVSAWNWTFDLAGGNGVTCAGCIGPNATYSGATTPLVTYPNPGVYNVRLSVTNANGSDDTTKIGYITVLASATDCDTLDFNWTNPAPIDTTVYTFSPNNYITGVPSNSITGAPPKDMYLFERHVTPNPGSSTVGGIYIAVGDVVDADGDMLVEFVVVDDDGMGAPALASQRATRTISPVAFGFTPGMWHTAWIPLNESAPILSAQFHVGVKIYPGDAGDEFKVRSSNLGLGGGAGANHVWSVLNGMQNYLTDRGANFDLFMQPMMGGFAPEAVIGRFEQSNYCDSTEVTIYDTVLWSVPTSWSFNFQSDNWSYNSATDPGQITRMYTAPGPEIVQISVNNACNRSEISNWPVPYDFNQSPTTDFSKNPLVGPYCSGVTSVTFAATPPTGMVSYTWDYGDGTSSGPLTQNTASHVYATPGNYYVTLDAVSYSTTAIQDTFYLENFSGGMPGTYSLADVDGNTPAPTVNPPFDGTNATAWVAYDFDVDGDLEAVSNSWYIPAATANDWMATGPIGALPAAQALFWEGKSLSGGWPDSYEVRVSTTGALPLTIANYPDLLMTVNAENSTATKRSVTLGAYAGQTIYIAYRNISNNKLLLSIDNIRIGTMGTGCVGQQQKLDFVRVTDCTVTAPTAGITANPPTGCVPLTVNFLDASTGPDPPTTWWWDFGNGNFSPAANPSYTYTIPGAYTVKLTACNTGGCSSTTRVVTVVAPPGPPNAGPSIPPGTSYCFGTPMANMTASQNAGGTLNWYADRALTVNIGTGLSVAPTVTGTGTQTTYYITETVVAGCPSAPDSIIVTINAKPAGAVFVDTCEQTLTNYQVCFAISGAPPYTVNGVPTASPYCSGFTLPSGSTYAFLAQDANGCATSADSITGSRNCGCIAYSGTMTSATQTICGLGTNAFSHNTGSENLGFADTINFVLHTNPTNFIGSVLATNKTGLFSFGGAMAYGTTYYISAIVGLDMGAGVVDILDPCLSVAFGTPVIYYPAPTLNVSGGGTICPGSPNPYIVFTMTGTSPWTYTLKEIGGPSLFPQGSTTVLDSALAPSVGTYTVIGIADGFCPAANSGDTVIVIARPQPTANVITPNQEVCIGDPTAPISVALTGSGPWDLTYFNGTTSTNVSSILINPYILLSPGAGTYTITALNDLFCSAGPAQLNGSSMVTIHPLPTATITGGGLVCAGSTPPDVLITLTGAAPWNVIYTDGASAFPIPVQVSPAITITNPPVGTYSMTIVTDNNGCVATAMTGSPIVGFHPVPSPPILPADVNICELSPVVPLVASSSGGGTIQWYLSRDTTLVVDTNTSYTPPAVLGTTWLYANEKVGICVSSLDSVSYSINPLPSVIGDPDIILTEGAALLGATISNGTAPFTQIWSPNDGLDDATLLNASASPAQSTLYIITVTDQNGCVSSSDQHVQLQFELFIPTVITPDNDGVNDEWEIDNIDQYPEAVVQVFNRWGKQIFKSDFGYPIRWDGTSGGDQLPQGSYYFVIELGPDNLEPITGTISIID